MKIRNVLLMSGFAAAGDKCMVKTSTFAACQEICDISSSLGFKAVLVTMFEISPSFPSFFEKIFLKILFTAVELGSGETMTKTVE